MSSAYGGGLLALWYVFFSLPNSPLAVPSMILTRRLEATGSLLNCYAKIPIRVSHPGAGSGLLLSDFGELPSWGNLSTRKYNRFLFFLLKIICVLCREPGRGAVPYISFAAKMVQLFIACPGRGSRVDHSAGREKINIHG
ncbi:hypothetical protein HOY82DRAFT_192321 [Tuber indicum]|nr:hypothetical protein HOY82DRAFT_192321 [Tuber indicum]